MASCDLLTPESLNGITTIFTKNRSSQISAEAFCKEEKHEEEGVMFCEKNKVEIDGNSATEEAISSSLKFADISENEVNNTEFRKDTNVENRSSVEINSTVDDSVQKQQINSDDLVETEEPSKHKNRESKDADYSSEIPSDKALCQEVGNVSEESSVIKDAEDVPVIDIKLDRGEVDVRDDAVACSVGKMQSSPDKSLSNSIRRTGDILCNDQRNSSEVQKDDLLTYLLNNPMPEFRGKSGEISFWGFSMQGYSHSENDIKCQDKCAIRVMGLTRKFVVAGIADGLGSCDFSDEGAAVAVSSALDEINKSFANEENPTDDDIIDTLKISMRTAYECVAKYADQKGEELCEYYSTLTVVIYDGNDAFIAHAGDDGVVVLTDSGFYGLVTMRHKGDTANSVVPLQGETNWEFMIVRDIVGVVMATDGVLDAFVKREKEENRVLFPFIQVITKTENDESTILEKYKALFKTEGVQSFITDDITIISVINNTAMRETEFPSFNEKEWFRKNRERSESIFKALYPDQKLTEDIADAWLDRDKELLHYLEQLKML